MKKAEKDQARAFRKQGRSIKEIARSLQVAPASVSAWVRDIELSEEQKQKLTERGRSVAAIEKRRTNRIASTKDKHQKIIDAARADISELSTHEVFLIGTALYWGEGGKTNTGIARIANSDPRVIQFMMRYFSEVCRVRPEKFRGQVHTFSHLRAKEAEEYWESVSGIPRAQFFKTYTKPSRASTGKRDSTPYGTFQIYVCDTNLFLKIKGWIQGIAEFRQSACAAPHF